MKIRSDKRMNSYTKMKDENEISMGMMQWDEARNTAHPYQVMMRVCDDIAWQYNK